MSFSRFLSSFLLKDQRFLNSAFFACLPLAQHTVGTGITGTLSCHHVGIRAWGTRANDVMLPTAIAMSHKLSFGTCSGVLCFAGVHEFVAG